LISTGEKGMRRIILSVGAVPVILTLFMLATGTARASGSAPASSETLAVGPYIIDFNLYQNPPYVNTSVEVTVVPHDSRLQLQGYVTVEPGLGTDAVPLRFNLTPLGDKTGTLKGTIHMPVQGAWNIVINLNGPQGMGTAREPVTVAAPGAIPIWLGWLIGASPLTLIAFWIWRQHRYKRVLLAQSPGDDSLQVS